jgi:hypothetical protein
MKLGGLVTDEALTGLNHPNDKGVNAGEPGDGAGREERMGNVVELVANPFTENQVGPACRSCIPEPTATRSEVM